MRNVRPLRPHWRASLSVVVLASAGSACSKEDPAFTSVSYPPGEQRNTAVIASAADAAGRKDPGEAPGSGQRQWTEGEGREPVPNPEEIFKEASILPGKSEEGNESKRTDKPDKFPPGQASKGSTGSGRDPDNHGKGPSKEESPGNGTGSPQSPQFPVWVEKEFSTKGIAQVKGSFFAEDRWISQPIVLKNREEAATLTFQQVDRPSLTDTFRQGQGAIAQVESFAQAQAAGVLDLLVVIDNSASMKEEQTNLSTKLAPLITAVNGADWRIGVVTTDAQDGCLRALIKKSDPNPGAAFERAIAAGVGGDGNEQGFRQAVAGLSCSTAPWVRESSTVGVLIVSDEDNCSSAGADCPKQPWNSESYLLNFMKRDLGRTLGTDARVYGLIKHPSDKSCTTAYNTSTQYASAIAASGGTWGSICAADYGPTLTRISTDMASILKKQFALKTEPQSGSVGVTIIRNDGTRQNSTAFQLNGNVVTFTVAPPAQSRIEVNYRSVPAPQVSAFELAESVAPESLQVFVNESPMSASLYSLTGKTLRFASPPPSDAAIRVTYRKNIPLERSFELGKDVLASTLSVTTNGKPESDVTFDPASGRLNFAQAPTDGSQIVAKFMRTSGPVLSYEILESSSVVTEIKAQYADNTEVKVSLAPQKPGGMGSASQAAVLEISPQSPFRAGSSLWVQYRVRDQKSHSYALGAEPLPGSLELTSSLEECQVGRDIVAVENSIVVKCPTSRQLKVSYLYERETEPVREFDLSGLSENASSALAVRLDGRLLTPQEFKREGQRLKILPEVALTGEETLSILVMTKPY